MKLKTHERIFSRIVHWRPLAYCSSITEKLLSAPIVFLGIVGAYISTICMYVISTKYGYSYTHTATLIGLCVGGTSGIVLMLFARLKQTLKS